MATGLGGRLSTSLTAEQRAEAGALADLVREGGVVGALVRELAALLRLRSAGEESALVRADLEALLGQSPGATTLLSRDTPVRMVRSFPRSAAGPIPPSPARKPEVLQ